MMLAINYSIVDTLVWTLEISFRFLENYLYKRDSLVVFVCHFEKKVFSKQNERFWFT